MGLWNRDRSVERKLRQQRPEAGDELIDRLAESAARPRHRGFGYRPALAGLLTVAVFGALALSGGLSQAANSVSNTLGGGSGAAAPAIQTYSYCTVSIGSQTGSGSSKSRTITVTTINGFTGSVSLGASFSPATGVSNVGFSPNPATSSSTLSYKLTGGASGTLTVTGTANGSTCSASASFAM